MTPSAKTFQRRKSILFTTNGKVLIVDDDPVIIDLLHSYLSGEGWHCTETTDAEQALEIIRSSSFDLVILDIMMPRVDGFELCRYIRSICSVPIVMLSARGDSQDKVRCLDLGADDYLTKPFSLTELSARIRAVMRRRSFVAESPSALTPDSRTFRIDTVNRKVIFEGKEIRLSPIEFSLLWRLINNSGVTLTYAQLLDRVWGPQYTTEKEYLHVHIQHLRYKIEPVPANPIYIINVPGIGYRFENPWRTTTFL